MAAVTKDPYKDTISSPIDKLGAHYPWHMREDLVANMPLIRDITIEAFYEFLGVERKSLARADGEKGQSTQKVSEAGSSTGTSRSNKPRTQNTPTASKVFGSLQDFMRIANKILEGIPGLTLKFKGQGQAHPADHPTATHAKPDIVAYFPSFAPSSQTLKPHWGALEIAIEFHWGALEIAIEFHSAGRSLQDRTTQAASYAAYLLAARPDLISTLGLLVNDNDLIFFICDACGICQLQLQDRDDGQLNAREGSLDRTKIEGDDRIYFDIKMFKDSEFNKKLHATRLHYSSDPFGKRAHVYMHTESEGGKVLANYVIKDQYIRHHRRWTEKDLLESIHKNGAYPAVVRMIFWGTVPKVKCGDRVKVRIGMSDHGTSFMELDTPRKVLYAIYDLLEVTRGLYVNRGILHRDISPNKIRVVKSSHRDGRHLLNDKMHKHKTSILLIDFGCSEDVESTKHIGQGRTGTPVFMARAVQAGCPLPLPSTPGFFTALPEVNNEIQERYDICYPQRRRLFNGPFKYISTEIVPHGPFLPWRHELRHDGESSTWSLFWWAIQACPDNGDEENPIPLEFWLSLVPDTTRSGNGRLEISREEVLHPGYAILSELFEHMASTIFFDHHWALDENMREPEYVHEALQRLILNFIIKHNDDAFMDTKKQPKNRTIETEPSQRQFLSPSTIDSRRSASVSSGGTKRKAVTEWIFMLPTNDNDHNLWVAVPEEGNVDPQKDEEEVHLVKRPRTE
ncbi:hypothetical protein P691DRAFT_790331 [Macrolepiota fuliginosa MF-IS2]|uniref:Protein kinase domain-containing protein n=1 Tax=Macrolepiota fuliginosa MF-IS2 TaxID=1400762 RepID=A0A9P5XM28_9AGAR|nr:hypothetical protein P691DRAFT_790331 [Macrolepiota fuliginosa MF-IS2]